MLEGVVRILKENTITFNRFLRDGHAFHLPCLALAVIVRHGLVLLLGQRL